MAARPGTLVEHEGQPAQLISFSEDDKCNIALADGTNVEDIAFSSLTVPKELKKPGRGGDEKSFDMFMGPMTEPAKLAEEMSDCLFEKGFCVLRTSQELPDVEKVKGWGDQGHLSRLPMELEEGYLGSGGQGKVFWLEGGLPFQDDAIDVNDGNLTLLASLLQPYTADILGQVIEERTPGLVSLSLQEGEEEDYPNAMATDKLLGDYLGTWKRGLIRVVHFMGPASPSVTLDNKGGPAASALPVQMDKIEITAEPNTIIVFRLDCFNYSCTQDDVLTLMANFQSESPTFELHSMEGDINAVRGFSDGPGPPPGNVLNVLALQTRLACRWDESEMMNSGLQAGCDTVVEIPIGRFDVNFYFCPDPDELLMGPPRTIQRHTSYVDGTDLFDNRYFEISNNEAQGMGPLQRQIMEISGGLLYSQGITKKTSNRTAHHSGCSVGVDKDDYPTLGLDTGSSAGGNALAIIANRVSFVFNLKGPNYVCDTACSASLTATHCAKLMMYDKLNDPLDFFLACGTHLCLSPGPWIGCSMSHMVAPGGRCFTFDSSANGYLRGEGSSGMFLKNGSPMDDQMAIFRSSQIGQDGRSASLTAPNGPAQEEMISRAIKEAKMTPPESTAWECHGTGTSLGDPIEVGAVRKIQIKMHREEPLMISTAKSNIGHLEGGAAMAGMIKCVLQASHGTCLSTLHLRQLNAHLEHAAFEAFFETESTKFHYKQGHCQVSSLGFGGSNGHAVFWAKKNIGAPPDDKEAVINRIKAMSAPSVTVIGDNPSEWEWDGPDLDSKTGEKYRIFMSSNDPKDAAIRWEKIEDAVEDDEEDIFYSITGNFNSWEEDRMAPGDIPGVHSATVSIPPSGVLEFRFLKEGEQDQALAPQFDNCTLKTVPIFGPGPDMKNKWKVTGSDGDEIKIELLSFKGKYSVVWFKV